MIKLLQPHELGCATHQMQILEGTGPHAYKLWCPICNKNRGWLSRKDALKLVKPNKINTTTRSKQW